MQIKEAIQRIYGFRYLTDRLEIGSPLGRQCLMEQSWSDSPEVLEKEYTELEEVLELEQKHPPRVRRVREKLQEILNIRGTVRRLTEGGMADDPELFELKKFALVESALREMTEDWTFIRLPDLSAVVELLDPEGTRLPHFYVYDAYSAELAVLRKRFRQAREEGMTEVETDRLYFEAVTLEDNIRRQLCGRLSAVAGTVERALDEVGRLDVVLAKAALARETGCVRPEVTADDLALTVFRGLFNPELRDILRSRGKDFQAVDAELHAGAAVITGANMTGKTVLLKTIALAQSLAQFGFFVPAAEARIALVGDVVLCIGDEQDERSGLSSFAAEMFRIDEVWKRIRKQEHLLVLIDEPARTTNPPEGRAFVNGMVEFLTTQKCRAVLTTHYGGITAPCRKWRVRGFREEEAGKTLTVADLNDCIDYRLKQDEDGEVPREAIRIARMLGIDEGLLQAAERFISGAY